MENNNNNLISKIKQQILDFAQESKINETGKILSIVDGVVFASGLKSIKLNQIVQFENGTKGLCISIEENSVGIVLLENTKFIKLNQIVKLVDDELHVNVGDALLGRVVNALGVPIDNGPNIDKELTTDKIFKVAKGVMTRQSVSEPLETGIIIIDGIFPIGKGQRELIIGDMQKGKTSITTTTIENQVDKNVICVYVSIGQKNFNTSVLVENFKKSGALKNLVVVAANSSDLPYLQYLAPYSATSIAEYWRDKGKDVLIIYDDLTKHAKAYRTISLTLKRPPGRKAFPGDIFYTHSSLLERSARLNKENGGGSLTALPLVETQSGDISDYIPTNVISITDGQLYLDADLFNLGFRPPINIGTSVSRVGSAAQYPIIKDSSSSIKLDMSQYEEVKQFSQFITNLDKDTKMILDKGEKIRKILIQETNERYDFFSQAIFLYSIKHDWLKKLHPDKIVYFKKFVANYKDDKEMLKLQKFIIKQKHRKLDAKELTLMQNFVIESIKKINNG